MKCPRNHSGNQKFLAQSIWITASVEHNTMASLISYGLKLTSIFLTFLLVFHTIYDVDFTSKIAICPFIRPCTIDSIEWVEWHQLFGKLKTYKNTLQYDIVFKPKKKCIIRCLSINQHEKRCAFETINLLFLIHIVLARILLLLDHIACLRYTLVQHAKTGDYFIYKQLYWI